MSKSLVSYFSPMLYGGVCLKGLAIALVSYLEVRSAKGKWLIYVTDNESPYLKKQLDLWLSVFDTLGFEWDNKNSEQIVSLADHQQIINRLLQQGLAYACDCSDEQLKLQPVYSGCCRDALKPIHGAAIRLRAPNLIYRFEDRCQGLYSQHLGDEVGDFIIRDKQGNVETSFAMLLGEAKLGVTQVVRSVELMPITPKQLYLRELLGFSSPSYLHVPKLPLPDEASMLASLTTLTSAQRTALLIKLLKHLGQPVTDALYQLHPNQLLAVAQDQWSIEPLIKW